MESGQFFFFFLSVVQKDQSFLNTEETGTQQNPLRYSLWSSNQQCLKSFLHAVENLCCIAVQEVVIKSAHECTYADENVLVCKLLKHKRKQLIMHAHFILK